MSSSRGSSRFSDTVSDFDTKTLPRIGVSRRDAEIWKFIINDWFKREVIYY